MSQDVIQVLCDIMIWQQATVLISSIKTYSSCHRGVRILCKHQVTEYISLVMSFVLAIKKFVAGVSRFVHTVRSFPLSTQASTKQENNQWPLVSVANNADDFLNKAYNMAIWKMGMSCIEPLWKLLISRSLDLAEKSERRRLTKP